MRRTKRRIFERKKRRMFDERRNFGNKKEGEQRGEFLRILEKYIFHFPGPFNAVLRYSD